jgi:hypothetical protein
MATKKAATKKAPVKKRTSFVEVDLTLDTKTVKFFDMIVEKSGLFKDRDQLVNHALREYLLQEWLRAAMAPPPRPAK